MQSATKIALASLALLGTVAFVAPAVDAQVYNGPTPGYCGPMTSQMTNWILDPATGQPITEAQYLARYPSNPATWSYNCNTGLWTDPGSQAAYQAPAYYQGPSYYQGRGHAEGRGYARESRNVQHDQGRGHGNANGHANGNGNGRGNEHDKGHGKG